MNDFTIDVKYEKRPDNWIWIAEGIHFAGSFKLLRQWFTNLPPDKKYSLACERYKWEFFYVPHDEIEAKGFSYGAPEKKLNQYYESEVNKIIQSKIFDKKITLSDEILRDILLKYVDSIPGKPFAGETFPAHWCGRYLSRNNILERKSFCLQPLQTKTNPSTHWNLILSSYGRTQVEIHGLTFEPQYVRTLMAPRTVEDKNELAKVIQNLHNVSVKRKEKQNQKKLASAVVPAAAVGDKRLSDISTMFVQRKRRQISGSILCFYCRNSLIKLLCPQLHQLM